MHFAFDELREGETFGVGGQFDADGVQSIEGESGAAPFIKSRREMLTVHHLLKIISLRLHFNARIFL